MAPNVDEKRTDLPPLIFPKENVTVGAGLPPIIFPKENVTVGDQPIPAENGKVLPAAKDKVADIPPLIFPKTIGSVPLVELPPLIFPDNNKTFTVMPPTNETALKILNAVGSSKPKMPDLDDDYNDYSDDSDASEPNEEVENVQPIDKNIQLDGLEENYK